MPDPLSQSIAAAIAGMTPRRLRQLDHESDPPPKNPDGTYPPREFGRWLYRRELAKLDPRLARAFDAGAGTPANEP